MYIIAVLYLCLYKNTNCYYILTYLTIVTTKWGKMEGEMI